MYKQGVGLVFCLILLLLMGIIPSSSGTTIAPVYNDQGYYEFDLIAKQFEFTMVNLVEVQLYIKDGLSLDEARNRSTYYEQISELDPGRGIVINAKSADIPHGIQIIGFGINLELSAPLEGQPFGEEVLVEEVLPAVNQTLEILCSVYCGEGHSSMRFSLLVGSGTPIDGDQLQYTFADPEIILLFSVFALVIIGLVVISKTQPAFLQRGEHE